MPGSPSYFSRHITFNDSYVLVQDLARKYGRLPVVGPGMAEQVAWRTKEQYRLAIGEKVKGRDYADCLKTAKRLHQIHPDLMPEEVKQGIRPFKRDINFYLNTPKVPPIDKFGRSHGAGRRKESVAQAWVVEGTGEVLVNGKSLKDAFKRVHDRESALWALKSMNRMDKYNVWAKVQGGGTTGQAEALAMAVAKAIIVHEPALKTPLRKGRPDSLTICIIVKIHADMPTQLAASHVILGLSNERRRAVSRPEGGPSGLSDKGRWSTSWKSGAKSERAYAMEYFQKHFPSVPEPATRSRRWLAPTAVMGLPWGSIPLHARNSLWRGMYQQCTYLYLIENAKVRSKKNSRHCQTRGEKPYWPALLRYTPPPECPWSAV